MSLSPTAAFPGLVLSKRYELESKIASGGMAQVWRGRDITLDRPIAIKVLHSHLAGDQDFVTRFRREAVAAAGLSHRSIVGVYDTVSQDDFEAIVMELIDGATLRDRLNLLSVLPPAEVIDIGIQVAGALDAAHRAGIVHRDIKPANIMLGLDGRVLVTDFGIAKANQDDDLTHTGTLLGTAKYLSPEQVAGDAVDPRSDLYSLGVVLFEAATGSAPFDSNTDAATALARLQHDAPHARHRRAEVPVELDAVIAKALSRNPDLRYDRATSMLEALRKVDVSNVRLDTADLGPSASAAQPATLDNPIVAPPLPPPIGRPQGTQIMPTAALGRDPRPPAPRPGPATSQKEPRKPKRAKRLLSRLVAVGVVVAALLGLISALSGAASGDPIAIVEATPFDPEGTPPYRERNDLAANAFDDDTDSFWQTESYDRAQFGGGLKNGVGLILELERSADIDNITLVTQSSGWAVEVYINDDGDFGDNGRRFSPDNSTLLTDLNGDNTVSRSGLSGNGRFVLLWITETGRPNSDDGKHRFVLSEITVR